MRRWVGLVSAALLAGCGEGGEDFTVDVAMGPGQVQAELARIDGGMALRALSLAQVTGTQAGNELSFVLPGDEGSAELAMRFEEVGTNMTRIHVSLDLPTQISTIQGQRMMLSEAKAEDLLEARMKGWAEGLTTNSYGSLDELNNAIGGLSIAMQPKTLNAVLAAGDNPDQLSQILDPEVMAEMMGSAPDNSFADVAALDEPMADPASEIADAARPMDVAQGVSAAGAAPKAAWSN